MDGQIYTPKDAPSLDEILNTEQKDVAYKPMDNVINDEIHTLTEPSNVNIPESEESVSNQPILITIEDQIITPKKNKIDFQGYELDNISDADHDNDVPSIKQVKEIVKDVESEKQDKLTAGDNITITDNVISAVDTTYTAGDNINITDNVISAVDTTYTAGDNITITDNVISAVDTTYTAGEDLLLSGTEFSVNWDIKNINITKEAAGISSTGYLYNKNFGKLVIATINFGTNANINGATKLFSGLPKPSSRVVFGLFGNDNKSYRAYVNTDGEIMSDGSMAANVWYNAQVVYFTN